VRENQNWISVNSLQPIVMAKIIEGDEWHLLFPATLSLLP
jgi:hypothetical protein